MKKRLTLVAAGVLLALSPAAAGAIGNTSLSHRVPVSGPILTVEPTDDNGGLVPRDQRTEAGDDRGVGALPVVSPSPAASPVAVHEAGDDKGGLVPRDQRVEPGDDRAVDTLPAPAGSPAPGVTHDAGDDGTGHDAGDDHGGSGHGGDDD